MLKLGEKIIYEISSNFELTGITKYSNADKKLSITNLGNIIISSENKKNDEYNTRYIYSYSKNRIKLEASLTGSEILVTAKNLPFTIISENSVRELDAELSLKVNLNDYNKICKNQRDFIFEFKNNISILELGDNHIYQGAIKVEDDRFIFVDEDETFEIMVGDIERYIIEGKILKLKGYFYIKQLDIIIKDISILHNNIKRIIPYEIDEIVRNNKKIGNLPNESEIAYCELDGNVDGIDYTKIPVLLVKYEGNLIFINKRTKKTILKVSDDNCYHLKLNKGIVLSDIKNIFRLYISELHIIRLDLNRYKEINNENIGFTKNNIPFFIKHDDEGLKIYKSIDKEMMVIKNSSIKSVSINKKSKSINKKYREVVVKFKEGQNQKQITLNLRNEILEELISDIFVDSKLESMEQTSIKTMYKNWAKGMTDMIIFNFFGNIYKLKLEIDLLKGDVLYDNSRLVIANKLHTDIQKQKSDLDTVYSYIPREMKKADLELFKSIGVKIETKVFKHLHRYMLELAIELERNLNEIEKNLNMVSFAMSNRGERYNSTRKLTEEESEKLSVYVDLAIQKLNHLIEDMYPYYIEKTNEELFKLFSILGVNYRDTEDKTIKLELLTRISKIYIFKEREVRDSDGVTVKELLERIYGFINKTDYKDNREIFFIESSQKENEDSLNNGEHIWGKNLSFLELNEESESEYEEIDIEKIRKAQVEKEPEDQEIFILEKQPENYAVQEHIEEKKEKEEEKEKENEEKEDLLDGIESILDEMYREISSEESNGKDNNMKEELSNPVVDDLYGDIITVEKYDYLK